MSTTPISNSSPSFIQSFLNQVTSNTPTDDTTTNSTQDTTPSYFGLNFGTLSVDRLGIFVPSNPEAIAAILAQVSLELEKTIGETANNRTIAHTAAFRSALTAFGEIISDMLGKQELIGTIQQQIDEEKAQVAAKTKEKGDLEKKNNDLQKQIDTKNTTIGNLDSQITGLNATIFGLSIAIGIVQAFGGDASDLINQRNAAQTELNQATTARNTTVSERDGLVAQKKSNEDKIDKLDKEIKDLNKDIEIKTAQQQTLVGEFFLLQSIMLNVFVLAALSIRGAVADDLLLAVSRNSNIFRAFEDLASNINEFGDLLRENIRNQSLRDLVRNEDDVRARVIAAAAGFVLGLADLLATLRALEAPPTVDQSQAPFVQGLRLHLAI